MDVPEMDQLRVLSDERAEAAVEADVREGRVVPHARVRNWLKSLIVGAAEPTPYSWRK
jgi:predicted transcriptional regulator